MADSNITCSGLTATSGVGQLALRWVVTNPNAGGLPYLDLATVEVWASASNDRSAALKIGEGIDAFLHAGVVAGATRFYWVRARNASSLLGEWHPVSPTAGVAGTAGSAQPGPGSITATELAPAAVTTPAIAPAAVTATAIANAAIERAKIAFAAVGSAQIEDGSIGRAKISFAAIGSAQIEDAAITNAKIGSLSADKITFGTLSGITISAVTINGGSLTGGSISGVIISGASISGTTITGGDIVGANFRTSYSYPSVEINSFGGVLSVLSSSGGLVVRLSGGTSGPVMSVQRSSPSSFCASFYNGSAGAVEAISPTFAFYASAGAYGPFTGGHELLWPAEQPLPEIGDLVADERVVFRNGVSNTLCLGGLAQLGRPALGVFAGEVAWGRTAAMPAMDEDEIEALGRTFRLILVNALGEGQINVCDEGGPISAGDLLIASSTRGKAMRQADDHLRSITAARSRETVIFNTAGHAQAACIYMGG